MCGCSSAVVTTASEYSWVCMKYEIYCAKVDRDELVTRRGKRFAASHGSTRERQPGLRTSLGQTIRVHFIIPFSFFLKSPLPSWA